MSGAASDLTSMRTSSVRIEFIAVPVVAFGLYWLSALVLEARGATALFGADTWFYTKLAGGNVLDRVAADYHLDRVVRFHPTTVFMAAAWMELLKPLTNWITPIHLLKGMFAAVGAVGVAAAMSAFSMIVTRRYVVPFGIIYACSLAAWYLSSIEESKIVTTSLSALYLAAYLKLRERCTTGGVALLTAILLLACLNEIVSGFLVIIPVVDAYMRRGLTLRGNEWIAVHCLAGPIALLILEVGINGRLVPATAHPEGTSHFGMLIYYVSQNDYSPASLYAFVINWLFFNIAAPTPHASYAVPIWPQYRGFFEPSLVNYFLSPVSAALVAVVGIIVAISVLPRYRAGPVNNAYPLVWALLAYSLVRGAFFLLFDPPEPLLFSSAVTLAHLLMIAIPFAASTFPHKGSLIWAFAVLLAVTNGTFMVGR
jgi:hypothetical protein